MMMFSGLPNLALSIGGVVGSYHADVAPGASIVLLAVLVFIAVTVGSLVRGRVPSVWVRITAGRSDEGVEDDVVVRR